MVRSNPYSTNVAMLRDYLKGGFDVYDWSHMLQAYYDEDHGGEYPKWFDPEDPTANIERMSAKDLKAFQNWTTLQQVDGFTPSTFFFDYRRTLPPTSWLIHFSDKIEDVVRHGFRYGTDDMRTLGLTTWMKMSSKRPGWNFAFEACDRHCKWAADDKKYGVHAVMFQAAAVLAYHNGDEEEQAIFWGPDVRTVIPLWREEGEFYVQMKTGTGGVLYKGDLNKTVEWVKRNHQQYRRVISWNV